MWFRKIRTQLSLFVYTLKAAETMSLERREKTVKQIKWLAEIQGLTPRLSEICEFSAAALENVPQVGGVYHFYQGNQLRYIGVARWNLQGRLWNYQYKVHNQKLAELIASGEARIAWYTCPYPGWMEDYGLTQYPYPKELYNVHKRGNRLE
jgi:hypothetical protein